MRYVCVCSWQQPPITHWCTWFLSASSLLLSSSTFSLWLRVPFSAVSSWIWPWGHSSRTLTPPATRCRGSTDSRCSESGHLQTEWPRPPSAFPLKSAALACESSSSLRQTEANRFHCSTHTHYTPRVNNLNSKW